MVLDTIHRRHKFPPWVKNFSSLASGALLDGEKVLLIKPTTFMNLSGQAVQQAAAFYKIPPDDIVVFHDELDLEPGTVRIKKGGGSAGHNGLKSIDQLIGPEYWRVRLGIGRPLGESEVTAHVLGNFLEAEGEWLVPLLAGTGYYAPLMIKRDVDTYMNKIAGMMPQPKEPAKLN
jgi:PTH1 family peptidyl-tRNA hydrolase